jgi:hypothetical protein
MPGRPAAAAAVNLGVISWTHARWFMLEGGKKRGERTYSEGHAAYCWFERHCEMS